MSRPEHLAPPEVFYSDKESSKYTSSSRIQHIQAEMTLRALELLDVPSHQLILDIGCGSGLSGEILTQEGHEWVGTDISPSMLAVGLDRQVNGDLILGDMGQGLPFRAGTFDAAISISAIQWLGNADSNFQDPGKRMKRFFETLYYCLKRGGKAVCQYYPLNEKQTSDLFHAAKTAGFTGGLVVDNEENKKNKKCYLVLSAGGSSESVNLNGVDLPNIDTVKSNRRSRIATESKKAYIVRKKELMKRRGKKVANTSKYTGRRRKTKF